jgi:hypothetical protein
MKKYIFTETQIKKVVDRLVNEQYSGTPMPEDMWLVQRALNQYFNTKNIRGVWADGTFKLDPKSPIIRISTDGAWGEKSQEALAIFQRNNGLVDDGYVGCCSANALVKQGYLKRDLFDTFLSWFGWEPTCAGNCKSR